MKTKQANKGGSQGGKGTTKNSCSCKSTKVSPENIKQAKGNECSQYKSTPAIFSSSLPICHAYFHLVMSRHVMNETE
jgi:hypothetical protein